MPAMVDIADRGEPVGQRVVVEEPVVVDREVTVVVGHETPACQTAGQRLRHEGGRDPGDGDPELGFL